MIGLIKPMKGMLILRGQSFITLGDGAYLNLEAVGQFLPLLFCRKVCMPH